MLLIAFVLVAGCTTWPASMPAPRDSGSLNHLAALLVPRPYNALVIEIDHAPSVPPHARAIQALVEEVRAATAKERIEVLVQPMSDDARFRSDHVWTSEELFALHGWTADLGPEAFGDAQAARLHVVYLPGELEEDVMGRAIGRVAFVLPDPPDTPDGRRVLPRDEFAERALLVHEVGHALGLVNNGVPMVTAREAEGGHSTHPESVMYGGTHVGTVCEPVADNRCWPYRFDADDLADFEAFRERFG